jgi:hypothetical protein
MAATWGLEVLESGVEGSVDAGDLWPDPADAVVVELFIPSGVDGAPPVVDGEVDDGLLDIDGVTVGWVDVEPAIPPRITLPTGIVKVEAPTVQQLSPQQ